jgi:L-ascorbate metabolism protein UlaG (beta-lactamase superfamily)
MIEFYSLPATDLRGEKMLIFGVIAGIAGTVALVYLFVDRALSAPRYHGTISDHFDGRKFHNLESPEREGFIDFIRWQLTRKPGEWSDWTESQIGPKPPARVTGKDLRVTFINHATVLVQTGGLNILTDPIWSGRASPFRWAGPKRHRSPGIDFRDLPPIDVVLLGHNHYDHFDISTIVRLKGEHRPHFVTGLGNGSLLRAHGITALTELDWWDGAGLNDDMRVTCVPAKHFSGRGLSDGNRTLWCGFVVQNAGGNIYFAGDTGMGDHFKTIKEHFGKFRLALLPIGAYLPRWFMCPVHISPREAAHVHRMLEPGISVQSILEHSHSVMMASSSRWASYAKPYWMKTCQTFGYLNMAKAVTYLESNDGYSHPIKV